jgi:hypothetical protein
MVETICTICEGAGYAWLKAIESVGAHWKRKGATDFAIVKKLTRFRAPCVCPEGPRWLTWKVAEERENFVALTRYTPARLEEL